MTAGKIGRRTALKATMAAALAGTGQVASGRHNVLRYALAVTSRSPSVLQLTCKAKTRASPARCSIR